MIDDMVVGARRFTTESGDTLIPGRKLAAGGQGEVFAVARGQVFKRYLPATLEGDPSLERRLRAMTRDRPEGWRDGDTGHLTLAWPTEVVLEDSRFTGFLMPAVDMEQTVGLHRVTNPTDRQTATGATAWTRAFTWDYLIRTGANLARATHALHQAGVVIGDFNESNVRASRRALVTLLDCDSMQITDPASGERFFCPVGRPEFTPPELLNADWHQTVRHPSSDLFALAVHVYQLLLEGEHPFRGVWRGSGEKPPVPELAREGAWAQRAGGLLRPRPAAISFSLLPASIAGMFRQAFEDGAADPAARPTALQWRDALTDLASQLSQCGADHSHFYPASLHSCPWCRHAATARPRQLTYPAVPRTPLREGIPAALPVPPSSPPSAAPRSGSPGAVPPSAPGRRIRPSAPVIAVILAALVFIGLLIGFTGGPRGYQPALKLTEPGNSAITTALAFSPDGKTIAVCDDEGLLELWDTATGSYIAILPGPAPFDSYDALAFSPDGQTLAAGASDGGVSLFDVATRQVSATVPDPQQEGARAMALSPDGATLAIGGAHGDIFLWSVTGRRMIATFTTGSSASYATSLAFSPDGRTLAATHADGSPISLWDVPTGHSVGARVPGMAYAVAFSPDGKTLAVGDSAGADTWNWASGNLAASFPGPAVGGYADAAGAVAFSPDGRTLAAGDSGDGTTRVWNLATDQLVATLNDPGGKGVNAMAFSPDGRTLATGDANGGSYLWNTSLWTTRTAH